MTVKSDFSLSENSEQILRNMDEKDVRSVNGVRVTEDILNLVYRKDVFKTALKVRTLNNLSKLTLLYRSFDFGQNAAISTPTLLVFLEV